MHTHNRLSYPLTWLQVQTINGMYPYSSLFYNDIRRDVVEFLAREYRDLPEDTLLVAQSQHNGHGHQWGVLLIRLPGESTWSMIGEFGHGNLQNEYDEFVATGVISETPPAPEDCIEYHRRPSGIQLKDLPHFSDCLDKFDPLKEFFGIAETPLRSIEIVYDYVD